MHNFSRPITKVEDNLVAVGKNLRSPKKEFFATNRTLLATAYNEYDKLAGKDLLHTLSRLWEIMPEMDEAAKKAARDNRQLAYGLYGDDRPFVNAHWEYLTAQNGGETLYCPICGLHECEEMDHYVPRGLDSYPEYAAHLSNLIPLCHNCNHKKSEQFLDDHGNRIFFNAFYDILTSRELLECKITLNPSDGLPQIQTYLSSALKAGRKPDDYVISTVNKLELMKRFEAKARQILKKEMIRLSKRAGQDWEVIKSEMQGMATPIAGDPDVVTPAVMSAIADSKEMETWFKGL